jgi:hypothetical protein
MIFCIFSHRHGEQREAGSVRRPFESLRPAKKAVEHSGASVSVVRQEIGPETGSVVVVSRYSDWNAWVQGRIDQEFVRVREAVRNNPNPPPFDSITTAVFEEVSI